MARTPTEIIEDHLMRRLKGDVEGDITHNFAKDIIILSSLGTFRGHAGVRESAKKLKEQLGDAMFAYNHTMIEGDFGFLEWSANAGDRDVHDGADSFLIKDEKIVLQTIHYTAKKK
jgi:hypothetical protein